MKEDKFKKVYIALGSNVGDREINLSKARINIADSVRHITRESHIYETEPWGYSDQPDFLNQVVRAETLLTPEGLLHALLETEQEMGRIRTFKNASRIIDLDILFYGDKIINAQNLTIPHPFIQKRKFVLAPLAEIAPDMIHPVFKKSIKWLLNHCEDPLKVRALNQIVHS